jgi:hypothetical protein
MAQNLGVLENTEIKQEDISLNPHIIRKQSTVLLKNGQDTLKRGTLLQKENSNTFLGDVGTGGINNAVTTIPVASNTGVLQDGAVVRIGDELVIVGTYDDSGDEFTGCTRGAYETTAAAHIATADIDYYCQGDNDVLYVKYDGLEPIEGYLSDKEIDTSADTDNEPAKMYFSDDVVRSTLQTINPDVWVPMGYDGNSQLNFKEEN